MNPIEPRTCVAGTLLVLLFLVLPVSASAGSRVVLASFSTLELAETQRIRLQSSRDIDLEISAAEVRGITYYRLHTLTNTDPLSARSLLARLRDDGFPDAWISHTSDTQVPNTPDAQIPNTLVPATVPTTVPATPEFSPERADQTLALIKKDQLGDAINFAPSAADEVPATSEPIELPKFSDAKIKIDGKLDEPLWSQVIGYDNMRVIEPDTLERPAHRTTNKIFYTDEGLYVGVMAEQPAHTLVARLTSRDQDINRDGTYMNLDPTGEGLYGFFFGVNLGGSITDGTILPEMQFSRQWDGAWYGNAVETEYGYSTEMFIPWSIMAMPEGSDLRKMAFYVSRKVAYLDERWGWPTIPYTRGRFMSDLQPVQLKAVHPGRQLAFYPFAATTYDNIAEDSNYKAGLDVFWRPSTNLQLTATMNPDFGAVESDDVVVNLTATETFFPEKRLFFLEGSEIFVTSPRANVSNNSSSSRGGARKPVSSYTPEPTTLVNTRRIGGPPIVPNIPGDVSVAAVELGKPTELVGALKATGQLGAFRYGAMGAAEKDTRLEATLEDGSRTTLKQTGRDFGVLRLLYEDTGKGRRSLGMISTLMTHETMDAMTQGIDAHYLNETGNFSWDAQLMRSDVDQVEGYGGYMDVQYVPRRGIFHRLSLDYLDDKLDVDDLGFISRNDVQGFRYNFSYTTTDLDYFLKYRSYVSIGKDYNSDHKATRNGLFTRQTWTLPNRSQINAAMAYFGVTWDDLNSEGHGSFPVKERGILELSYGTNTADRLSTSVYGQVYKEQLGQWSMTGKLGVTWKPSDRFSLDVDLSYRRRPNWLVHLSDAYFATYRTTDLQPRVAVDVFLSARQQLRFTMQWAGIRSKATELFRVPEGDGELVSLNDNITVPDYDFTISRITSQLRYRWEIAPLSDLFVVYTRGSNLPSQVDDEFGNLFNDALINPIIEMFVVKLRYRFAR